MMATHTPGPWFAHAAPFRDNWKASKRIFDNGLWHIRQTEYPDLCPIAEIDRADDRDAPTREQAEANARLIAASPDLLALVIQYRDDLRHPPTADSITRRLAAIDAVLAKVGGDT